jgi:hypothetical protein
MVMTEPATKRERRIQTEFEQKVRLFSVLFGVLAVALLLTTRLAVGVWWSQKGAWYPFTIGLLDALISTAVVSACLAFFSTVLRPRPIDDLESSPLPAAAISPILRAAAQVSRTWEYHGHTGRFVRSSIFPILRQHAQETNVPIRIRVSILDPRSADVVSHYSKYRKQARSGARRNGENWDTDQIRKELLATVLCVAELHSLDLKFDVEVRLANHVNVLRFDLADDLILVTEEDARRPGFRYTSTHSSYELFVRMINLSWTQAELLEMPDFDRPIPFGEMTPNEAEQVVSMLGQGMFATDDVTAALDLYRQRSNPY